MEKKQEKEKKKNEEKKLNFELKYQISNIKQKTTIFFHFSISPLTWYNYIQK